ncbi:MAG: MATE family efflux transporter [Eubacteriales bacterium]|nr:MATE family efflux transporter [Eubacteriales bacterium]
MNDVLDNPLSKDFTISSLLKFAFPTMLTMVFMGLYTIGDTIFVSRFVNTDALSAINIVTPIINLIVGLGTMLATGGSAIIARKMGAGRSKEASQDFTLIVLSGAILGILIAITGNLFLDDIIYFLGASEILFPYCKGYLFVLLFFTPASMLQVLFQNLIITAGRPSFGMVLSISAGAINVLLDYVFMVLLNMGIKGSALGTGIGYLIPTIISIAFFLTGKGSMQFKKPAFRFSVLFESCSNGCSEMVSQAAAAITTFLFNATMLKLLGENGVAAITIIIYSQFLLTTLYIGFSMGVAPVISYNYGGKNHQRLKKVFRICLLFIVTVSALIFAISIFFGSYLVNIFSSTGTPVYDIAKNGFLIFSFSFLCCGINIFTSATFTALSNGKISAIISFLRTFGLITILLLTLPQILGVNGVWLAVPIAELITLIVSIAFLQKKRSTYHYM